MRSFDIANLTFQALEPTQEMTRLLNTKLKVKVKVEQVEYTSHVTSEALKDNYIMWGETFSFEDIPKKVQTITICLIQNQDDQVLCCSGNLIFNQAQQFINAEWNTHKIIFKLGLTVNMSEIQENSGGQQPNSNVEEIAKKFVKSVKQQAIKNSQHPEKEQTKTLTEREQQGKKSAQENQKSKAQTKRRETEQELELAHQFKHQKQSAQGIAREQIKRLSTKVLKKLEQNKFENNNSPSQKKKETAKESKQITERNKENRQLIQRAEKTPNWEEDDDDLRNHSPKSSMMKSQSLARSMIRDQVRMYRTRYGDKIYENQSATTMQKSVLCFSVPKGPRFKHLKYNGVEPSYYVGTSFAGKNKGTSFGYGTRKPYPQWMVRNMNQNPAPNLYTVNQPPVEPTSSSKGFSFGISYKYYQKTGIIGAQSSKRSTKTAFPKLSKPQTFKTAKPMTSVDPNAHYHYRKQ